MSSIRLTGLVGSHPLGALAAFGLLRIVSGMQQFKTPRLSWKLEQDWLAVLHITDLDVAEDQLKTRLLCALVERQQERAKEKFLTWSDDIKVESQRFVQILKEQAQTCTFSQREVIDFFAAFGSEVVHLQKGDVIKPTAFHLTSGNQKFLKVAREIADSLNPSRSVKRGEDRKAVRREIEEAFARALFGPWHCEDPLHCLGWDPSREALHALSAIAPTEAGSFSERSAVWLAFEALPLFPCFPNGNRLRTRGFDDNRPESFSWPIWQPAISVNTLASLLALPELIAQNPEMKELIPRGIVAVYRSICERDAKGRGIFRNAVLCGAGELPKAILKTSSL